VKISRTKTKEHVYGMQGQIFSGSSLRDDLMCVPSVYLKKREITNHTMYPKPIHEYSQGLQFLQNTLL